MSSRSTTHKRSLKAPTEVGAQTYGDHLTGQNKKKSFCASFLFAPLDRKKTFISIIIFGALMEMIGTMLYVVCTNMLRSAASGTNVLLDGLLIGGLSGLCLWIIAGGWRRHVRDRARDEYESSTVELNELPRLLNWTLAFGLFLVNRLGLFVLLGYWTMQTMGALAGGGLLWFFGAGVVPTASTAHMGRVWAAEIIGSAVITLCLLFSHMLGGSIEDEDRRLRKGMKYVAYGRALMIAVLYQYQGYAFDAVIYLGGLIGLCTSAGCPNATPFDNAPVFYMLVPLLGGVVGVVIYLILLGIYSLYLVFSNEPNRTKEIDDVFPKNRGITQSLVHKGNFLDDEKSK